MTIEKVLFFFSQYTDNIIIDYVLLHDIIVCEPDQIQKVIKFLTLITKVISIEQIYRYYLYPHFTKRTENGYTAFFDVSNFLDFAIHDFDTFENEIIEEFEI